MFPVGHVHKHNLLHSAESARVHTVLSMSPSILHSAHEAKAKMDLENGSGEWLCCLKRLYFLRKAVTATVVLIDAIDAIDPGKL